MTMLSVMRKIVASVNASLIVAPILALLLCAAPLSAQNPAPEYTFVVASGFLCDTGNCPAVARSERRDTYEFTGAGTFNAQTKAVSAAGTFAHKIPNGTVVETGVWTSNQLISFDSYGAAPNALRQRGIVAGVPLPPQSIADVLQSDTHRRPGGIPYPHAARRGNAYERRAAGKLRFGGRAARSLCGRDPPQTGQESHRVLRRIERKRDVPGDAAAAPCAGQE